MGLTRYAHLVTRLASDILKTSALSIADVLGQSRASSEPRSHQPTVSCGWVGASCSWEVPRKCLGSASEVRLRHASTSTSSTCTALLVGAILGAMKGVPCQAIRISAEMSAIVTRLRLAGIQSARSLFRGNTKEGDTVTVNSHQFSRHGHTKGQICIEQSKRKGRDFERKEGSMTKCSRAELLISLLPI